jgi:hypothetical protein
MVKKVLYLTSKEIKKLKKLGVISRTQKKNKKNRSKAKAKSKSKSKTTKSKSSKEDTLGHYKSKHDMGKGGSGVVGVPDPVNPNPSRYQPMTHTANINTEIATQQLRLLENTPSKPYNNQLMEDNFNRFQKRAVHLHGALSGLTQAHEDRLDRADDENEALRYQVRALEDRISHTNQSKQFDSGDEYDENTSQVEELSSQDEYDENTGLDSQSGQTFSAAAHIAQKAEERIERVIHSGSDAVQTYGSDSFEGAGVPIPEVQTGESLNRFESPPPAAPVRYQTLRTPPPVFNPAAYTQDEDDDEDDVLPWHNYQSAKKVYVETEEEKAQKYAEMEKQYNDEEARDSKYKESLDELNINTADVQEETPVKKQNFVKKPKAKIELPVKTVIEEDTEHSEEEEVPRKKESKLKPPTEIEPLYKKDKESELHDLRVQYRLGAGKYTNEDVYLQGNKAMLQRHIDKLPQIKLLRADYVNYGGIDTSVLSLDHLAQLKKAVAKQKAIYDTGDEDSD